MKLQFSPIFRVSFIAVGFLYCALGCTKVNLPDSTLDGDTRMTPTHTYIVPVTSEPDPLNGTRWELIAFNGVENAPIIPEEPQFFVEFRNGEVSLQGGCNSIGGHYVLKNGHITITFAERTEMDCSYLGPNVNEIEMAFSTALPTFDSYSLEDDKKLLIRYMDGELLLHRAVY